MNSEVGTKKIFDKANTILFFFLNPVTAIVLRKAA